MTCTGLPKRTHLVTSDIATYLRTYNFLLKKEEMHGRTGMIRTPLPSVYFSLST